MKKTEGEYKIIYVLEDLRRMKVVGPSSKDDMAALMYQSRDTLLLRYTSRQVLYSVWILVRRTSRQCYKIFALTSRFEKNVVEQITFRNSDSTCHWIKEKIRRY